MYGDGFLKHLSQLAAESAQLSSLTHSSLFAPFWDKVTYTPMGAIVDCGGDAVRRRPLFFWKESLKHIAHQMGVGEQQRPSRDSCAFVQPCPNMDLRTASSFCADRSGAGKVCQDVA